MNAHSLRNAARGVLACASIGVLVGLSGCASDGYGGGGVSTSVSYGYGGYYGPYYGGGYYYDPYPPVVIDRPDERPDRPNAGERPTTLPADVGSSSARPSTAPARPATSSRPTSRPSPRPAPRPMPRGGRGR